MQTFRKMALALGSLVLISSAFVSNVQAAAHGFSDTEGHWAEEEIIYLTDQNYLLGYSDGSFKPDNSINRAEAATVIFRQQGLTEMDADYTDVSADFWAQGNIGALQNEGIMVGYGDNTFRPDNQVTRAEAALILSNTFAYEEETDFSAGFSDVSAGDQAYEAVMELKSNHIMRGYGDGTFRPDNPITRAEFSVIIARTLNEDFREELVVTAKTDYLLDAIMNEDFDTVASYAHPTEGVRFSPYVYVQADHQVFHTAGLENWLQDQTVYLWGTQDGTGNDINKTTQEYYERFVIRHDYENPDERVYNEVIRRGNLNNNIPVFFPDAKFVEYHIEGVEEQYVGMDWGSIILVMQEYNDEWYLIAVVNDEWTI